MSIDRAALLRKYRISSLAPTQWEEIDHDLDLLGDSDGPSGDATGTKDGADPLGLKQGIESVAVIIIPFPRPART